VVRVEAGDAEDAVVTAEGADAREARIVELASASIVCEFNKTF